MLKETIKTNQELIKSSNLFYINAKHNYRYERKFTVPTVFSLRQIEQSVKNNSFLFREIYYQRQVNNIYFDTAGYQDYLDNVLGVSDRKKIRIRWYGDIFGKIEKPVLEIKIKKGLVGDKWSYKLKPFVLDKNFTNAYIQKIIKESDVPQSILQSVKMVSPTLLNSYARRYYLSADKKFRITLDFNLLYYKIESKFNNFIAMPVADDNKIVELKYALKDDITAQQITTQFPFRLNKNSKYVNGVNAFSHFPQ